MQVRQLSPVTGVELLGIDLAALADRSNEPASQPLIEQMRAAWLDHHLVLLRDQQLTPAQQAVVAGWIGPPEVTTPQATQRNEAPEGPVHYISNRAERGRAGDGELEFHSDSAVRPHPIRAVVLHALAVPSEGGDTLFANCMEACRRLSPSMVRELHGRCAHHGYDYDTTTKSPRGGPGFHHEHPVLMPHPLRDDAVLYLSRNSTTEIVGLAPERSDALLEELFAYIEAPDNIYRHRWSVGDVVLWDNVALVHARTAFDPAEARTLQRVTVSGAPAAS